MIDRVYSSLRGAVVIVFEDHSDEAIQFFFTKKLDCFAQSRNGKMPLLDWLAMTNFGILQTLDSLLRKSKIPE